MQIEIKILEDRIEKSASGGQFLNKVVVDTIKGNIDPAELAVLTSVGSFTPEGGVYPSFQFGGDQIIVHSIIYKMARYEEGDLQLTAEMTASHWKDQY